MSTRERFFTCRFVSSQGLRTAHVRAWDEREAAQLFVVELAEDGGPREPGVIEVFQARRRVFEARFDPQPSSAASASAAF